jgi:DNA ligase-1
MVMKAHHWDGKMDPTGWLVSEKLDGFFAQWKGGKLLNKTGIPYNAPDWFTKNLPTDVEFEGEIWAGRGNIHIVQSLSRPHDWKNVIFAIFEAPSIKGGFEKRIVEASRIISNKFQHAIVIPFTRCKGIDDLTKSLDKIVSEGAEGLMIKKPECRYEDKRTHTMLKVVKFMTAEAKITGYVEGNRKGIVGSLAVISTDGREFKVGGLTEAMKLKPPPIGEIITYRYRMTTNKNIPRTATFVRIRKED